MVDSGIVAGTDETAFCGVRFVVAPTTPASVIVATPEDVDVEFDQWHIRVKDKTRSVIMLIERERGALYVQLLITRFPLTKFVSL